MNQNVVSEQKPSILDQMLFLHSLLPQFVFHQRNKEIRRDLRRYGTLV